MRVHVCSRACVHVCAFVFTCVSQLDLLLVLEHTCFRLITCCANPWDAAHQCDGAIFDAQLARHDLGTEAEADTDTATELKSKARADTHTHTHTHTHRDLLDTRPVCGRVHGHCRASPRCVVAVVFARSSPPPQTQHHGKRARPIIATDRHRDRVRNRNRDG